MKETQQMPTHRNLKGPKKLTTVNQKERKCKIKGQIYKIRNSVENRQSRIAWQTVMEGNKRKWILTAKLKDTNQEERIHTWKNISRICSETPQKSEIKL